MEPPILLIETSSKVGQVGLAFGPRLAEELFLDEARRHARDLAPAVNDLLKRHRLTPRDVHSVVVSRGPGSYTGLRIGIMSAKTFAYATNCRLLAIDTFAAIANHLLAETVDIVGDAQQDFLYVQRFVQRLAVRDLEIVSFSSWLATLTPDILVAGPGLLSQTSRLASSTRVAAERDWYPRLHDLLDLAWRRLQTNDTDAVCAVEPLYLRPSSAEEQWDRRPQKGGTGMHP